MSAVTTISFPIDPTIRQKAKEKVEKHGLSLDFFIGYLVNELLKNFAEKENTKTDILIHLDKPTEYFKQAIKKAREDREAGKASPTFKNAEDAIKWLHK